MANDYIPGQFKPKQVYKIIEVIDIPTGEKIKIKNFRFNAEIHRKIGDPTYIEKKVEAPVVEEVAIEAPVAVERPFACECCDKTFKRAQDVKAHTSRYHA